MKAAAFLLAALAATAPPPAAADRSDREKEIVINADRSLADDNNRVLTFEGNVVVTQGTMRITATRLTMKEDAERNKSYVATGTPVTFRQKRDKVDEFVDGEARRAEFDEKTDMLRLYERGRVKSGSNEITGEFTSYDLRKEVAEVSGAPPGKQAPPNSRVKVIIVPPKKPAEGAKEAPGAPVELKTDPGKS